MFLNLLSNLDNLLPNAPFLFLAVNLFFCLDIEDPKLGMRAFSGEGFFFFFATVVFFASELSTSPSLLIDSSLQNGFNRIINNAMKSINKVTFINKSVVVEWLASVN